MPWECVATKRRTTLQGVELKKNVVCCNPVNKPDGTPEDCCDGKQIVACDGSDLEMRPGSPGYNLLVRDAQVAENNGANSQASGSERQVVPAPDEARDTVATAAHKLRPEMKKTVSAHAALTCSISLVSHTIVNRRYDSWLAKRQTTASTSAHP